ncbi:MAG: aldehyde dehydrogenase family protein, partial [Clostridia bacterium]|nr:aldehyde dehydrogenase family protein [Clostridia bacterium]
MSITQLSELVKSQKEFFKSGETLSLNFRKNALKKLYRAIKNNESKICKALHSDLGKSEYESFMCEVGLVLSEISYMIKNLKRFAKAKHVKTPLAQFAAKSFKQPSPYGTVLIMSPWNYPILLTLDPIVDAIAAGNTAVVKPSAYSPATAKVVKNIISECFTPEYVAVITGGRQENAALLNEKFDMVFFTGSPAVGREVLRKTAENLTPVVLELGG